MALKSEFETTCPCCQSTLVIDTNLKRVVRHVEPVRGDRPELSEAGRILAEEAARREALFEQSVTAEKNVWKVERMLLDYPHRSIRSSDRHIDRLRERYIEYRRRVGRKPIYYARTDRWTPVAPESLKPVAPGH